MKYGGYVLWNYKGTLLALALLYYLYQTVIKEFYVFDKKNAVDDFNCGSRVILRRSNNAVRDIGDFVDEHDYDDRYEVKPYGQLDIADARKNYLVRTHKINFKVKLVSFFFDLEYASSFNGIFN